MNPLYRSLTANIEVTKECGRLFIRTYEPRDAWIEIDAYRQAPRDYVRECRDRYDAYRADSNKESVKYEYHYGCILACIEERRPSMWFHEYDSDRLTREIEELERKREAALCAELADRPALEVTR